MKAPGNGLLSVVNIWNRRRGEKGKSCVSFLVKKSPFWCHFAVEVYKSWWLRTNRSVPLVFFFCFVFFLEQRITVNKDVFCNFPVTNLSKRDSKITMQKNYVWYQTSGWGISYNREKMIMKPKFRALALLQSECRGIVGCVSLHRGWRNCAIGGEVMVWT